MIKTDHWSKKEETGMKKGERRKQELLQIAYSSIRRIGIADGMFQLIDIHLIGRCREGSLIDRVCTRFRRCMYVSVELTQREAFNGYVVVSRYIAIT